MKNTKIFCYGEVLWDLLPSGKVAGGAPMNVAVQLNNLGTPAFMISKAGSDDLGEELIDFLQKTGLDTQYVQIDFTFPTGTVNVRLENGMPSYEIVENVAWDHIHPLGLPEEVDVLVFGSLILRSERSRMTLETLLEKAKIKVLDVNLRAPFFEKNQLISFLKKANIVKMNDEELEIICRWYGVNFSQEKKIEYLFKTFELDTLLVTLGAKGAILFDKNGLFFQKGTPVNVEDTIGSGDAFTAGFLHKKLSGASSEECLKFASVTGALLATKKGGTAKINEQEVVHLTL